MKITIFILFACFMQISAKVNAQISISDRNVPITSVLAKIQQQSGYNLFYENTKIKDVKISINLNNVSLAEALDMVLKDQELTYALVDKTIVIKIKEPSFLERVVDAFTPPVDVRGLVLDEKGMPLAGVNVKVKGFKQSAVTDNEGRFYLPGVDDKAVLIVSFVGYKDVEVGVKASLSVVLELKAAELNEVVVAYGKTTQQALTGSVTVVKGEQIQNLPNRSFDKSLQGLVPGLLVTSGDGQPGSSPSNFILRGIATGGQPTEGETFRNPLIVIDGIPVSQEPAAPIGGRGLRFTNPLAQINPSDIESISVLKDAAAIALYGAKASNGVILVTTKKGKVGKTTFNFRHQTDLADALDGNIKMLNQEQYLELLYESYKNSNATFWTDARIDSSLKTKFPLRPDGSFYPQEDWTAALFHKSALTMTNELSLSGGSDKSTFYMNLEYTKQDGAAKNTGYDRKSFRLNYNSNPVSWLRLGVNSMLSYNIQNYNSSGDFLTGLAISPLNPIRNTEGDYIYNYAWGAGSSGTPILKFNPVAQAELNINSSTAYKGMTALNGEIRLSEHISFRSSVGIDFALNEVKQKSHPLLGNAPAIGEITEQPSRATGIINSNILQFNKTFYKKHTIGFLLAQEAQIHTEKYSFISKAITTDPNQEELSSGKILEASGNSSKRTQLSYFSQANYSFDEKYYLSGSIRTDGSSNFGINNRYGTYWSIGAGWVASQESFLQGVNNWLSYFKLRGSMGPAGNSAAIVDRLHFDQLLRINFLNGVTAVYPLETGLGNPSIQWEQTFVWDAGAELRLFQDRISITADLYNRKTKNLIAYDIPLPWATGSRTLTGNVGDIKNHGVELALSVGIIRSKNFNWNVSLNWSRNQNKLTKSVLDEKLVMGTQENVMNKVGYEYNSFYLRKWAGVNPDNGKPMWIDSLGKPSEDYLASKPEIVGKVQPDGFGGLNTSLNYRDFELSIGLYYQYGSKIYFTSQLQNDGSDLISDPYLNQNMAALDRWQKPGDIATNPRRLLNSTNAAGDYDVGAYYSTRYLYDGDFIRLGNVQLGYSLPKDLLRVLHVNTARVFVQGTNLVTWTKYSGQDPENVGPSGLGGLIYPQSRSYSIGLNVNF